MSTAIPTLKLLVAVQLLIGVSFGAVCSFLWGPQLGASFAIGAALMLINIFFLSWSFWRILAQKTIAWTLLVIVIKYTVLLGSVFYLARTSWFRPIGAAIGITSFVLAALLTALFSNKNEKEKK